MSPRGCARVGVMTALAAMTLMPACRKEPAASPPAPGPFVLDDPALVERNNRGVGLMGRFDYEAAHDAFRSLLEEHPGWLEVKVNLAIATFNRQQEGDEKTGLRLLAEVLDADPDHLRAHYCSGILKLRAGEMTAARAHFETVVEGDPDDAYAAYSYAQTMEGEDPEAALRWYDRALQIDPYLRSGYYRAYQVRQRLGRRDEARPYFESFQRLESNPQARLVEVKYTRMGPKAETLAFDRVEATPPPPPSGPLFAEPVTQPWSDGAAGGSLTACDIDGDGMIDLFGAAAETRGGTVVALQRSPGSFTVADTHPLHGITGVRAALWGDVDGDGRVDVYLCHAGPNRLMRQTEAGWEDVTERAGVAGEALDSVDGVLVDADHDGDLDVYVVNADGPSELFSNNLDGTFRPLGVTQNIGGASGGARQVLATDVDRDRDLDLLVLNKTPPHDVYLNDRLWEYHAGGDPFASFVVSDAARVQAADVDADGMVELYTLHADGSVRCWRPDTSGRWEPAVITGGTGPIASPQLALLDVTGDGRLEIIASGADGWWVGRLDGDAVTRLAEAGDDAVTAWAPVVTEPAHGPTIVGLAGEALVQWRPGPGRFAFAALAFSGRTDTGTSMRSNVSGIGTRFAARRGSQWTVATAVRADTGPGQSLQPYPIGLGGADRIDFVAIDWSDGVFQSEIELAGGSVHTIAETQRQLSSCPVLFAWDGSRYRFISDLLGVGGMGYLVAPGEYADPRPWENFLFPPGSITPRDGRYLIKIGEPMEEACYLDAARLIAYDLPPGWQMTLDERMQILGPAPTGAAVYYRDERLPARAVNDRGVDVASEVREPDRLAAPVGALDHRFIGRLANEHVLTLTFEDPLDTLPGVPTLVIDGWIEYPYSQTMFAAWQAHAAYEAPTLDVRDGQGRWRVHAEQFGYPAGMPRRMSMPMNDLPAGVRSLRLRTNQEIYWDRIAVVGVEPCPDVRVTPLAVAASRLAEVGFALRTTGPQRLPHYDYTRRAPLWDTRHQRGFYTAFGPVGPLLAAADDATAIIGPGEEIHLEFAVPARPAPAGWTRHIVLEAQGWCKDMDLFTQDGETLEPLPESGRTPGPRDALRSHFNTRYEGGR